MRAAGVMVALLTLSGLQGLLTAPAAANPIGPGVDWVSPPATFEKTYAVRVPQVDGDGNEVAGIRLPTLAVPLGTYTGWNVYRAFPSELCDRDGTYLPFARTRAEREGKGDSRPSLAERYASKDDYQAKVKVAAEALVKQRLLLEKDAVAYVEQAKGVGF